MVMVLEEDKQTTRTATTVSGHRRSASGVWNTRNSRGLRKRIAASARTPVHRLISSNPAAFNGQQLQPEGE